MMKVTIIKKKIFYVRGVKVMLDYDLASLYEVETKALNQAVKRNIGRFPKDFMFRLTTTEWNFLRSQNVTLENSDGRGKFSKYLPYAFTEYGVGMLASVLKSERAMKMNVAIVRAFIALKKFGLSYAKLADQIKALKSRSTNHEKQLKMLYVSLDNLLRQARAKKEWQEKREMIGFKSKKN
jgi:hypothetical protein